MKVTFLSEVTADGMTYLKGENKTIPDDLATSFIASGWAEPYAPRAKEVKEQRPYKPKEKPA